MSQTAGRRLAKRALRSHLEIRSLIREPVAVVAAQSRNFADGLLVTVRHLHTSCRALQHTTHKP
jgi:hypothetical protein